MSISSLPAPHDDPKPKKKRHLSLHLNLPSFRKSRGERAEADADEIARVRKAAAWQWYTRGVADAVVPTKRVPAAAAAASSTTAVDNNVQERPKSRFKAEVSARKHPASVAATAAPSPLYDEFELSGLKSYMAEFVQRLQQRQQEEDDASAANPGTKDEIKLNQKPPSVVTFPISSFQLRPLSAIHKFFRKISWAIKSSSSTKSSSITANHGQPVADEKYNYHHYIHHHHHHHHFGCSKEESLDMIRRRGNSESSNFGHTLWEAAVNEEVESMESRRRRHSETFYTGSFDRHEEASAARASPLSRRHYNSERFSPPNYGGGGGVDHDQIITTPRIRRRSESFCSYKSDCGAPYLHEAAAYKLPPSPSPSPSPTPRRRHSDRFDPSYRSTNYELPNKPPRSSPRLRQPPPMRRHFESLSERKLGVAEANADRDGGQLRQCMDVSV